jgi:hypothetical protein
MLLFGGKNQNETLGDLWALDYATGNWSMLHAAGAGPGRRFGHAMAYDPQGARAILFGGYIDETRFMDDTWAFRVAPDVPTPTATRDVPSPTATSETPVTPPTATTTRDTTPATPGTPVVGTATDTPDGGSETATATTDPSAPTPSQTVKVPGPSATTRPMRVYLPRLVSIPDPPPPTPLPTPTSPPCLRLELEPNNSFTAATEHPPLCPDVHAFGAVPEDDPEDLYRVEVAAPGVIDLRLFDLPAGTDFELFLFDGARQLVKGSQAPETEEERIEVPVVAGTYFVRVFPLVGRSPRPYRLSWYVR